VVVGTPGKGVTGFRQTHSQALAAQHIAEFLRQDSDMPRYFSDLHLLTLLDPDHQKIDDFVRSELRDLASAGAAVAELRATLTVYLDNHSPQATANQMHISRNTVTYRLRRVEEFLHHTISERQTEMRLALLLKG
jgi:DNA-binding PucR family transcriptional regulator